MRLFVSYRRDDTEGYVGLLQLALQAENHRGTPVELYVDSVKIQAGAAFTRAILDALKSCDAVLVFIGPQWRGANADSDQPRIFKSKDTLRLEVRTALSSGVPVFAALMNGASMPTANEIPTDLAKLTTVPAWKLSDQYFNRDAAKMVAHIRSVVHPPERVAVAPASVSMEAVPGVYWSSVELLIDGQSVGRYRPKTDRPAEFRIEPGTHTIQTKSDVWKSNPVKVKAAPGETVRVLFTPGLFGWQTKLTLVE